MKIIYPEVQNVFTTVTGTDSTTYPITNLSTNKLRKYASATPAAGYWDFTITTTGDSDTTHLFYTNATTAAFMIPYSEPASWGTANTITFGRYRHTYTLQSATIGVRLYKATGDIYLGAARVGPSRSFKNPKYGMSNSPIDTSIVQDLASGGLYVKKRNLLRNYDANIIMSTETEEASFTTIYDYYHHSPAAILLLEDIDDSRYSIFGQMEETFKSSFDWQSYNSVGLNIREAI